MILTSQFWDFISIYFYVLVMILTILAFIVDVLVLWVVWELIWYWLRKKSWFKKKGYEYE